MEEVLKQDAAGQAEMIRRREISPVELVTLYLERVAQHNPRLNALVYLCAERALEEARLKERTLLSSSEGLPAFFGVPFAMKDLDDMAGIPTTYSHVGYRDFVPSESSEVVKRLLGAGFITIGKSNVPEFGAAVSTESLLNGVCRNPWNPEHSAGGSSGGAGAAVAAGLVPIAQASDGAGSIRIPAACCGLVGLKPSRGRVTPVPGPASNLEGCGTQGCVSRSVRDAALVLDAIAGAELGDIYVLPETSAFDGAQRIPPLGRVRAAIACDSPTGGNVYQEGVDAARTVGAFLSSLGHEVEEVSPPWYREEAVSQLRAFYSTLFAYDRPM